MKSTRWYEYLREYTLPVVVLALPMPLTVIIGTLVLGFDDPDFFGVLVVAPFVAFLVGAIFRPTYSWVAPTMVVVLLVTFVAISQGIDRAADILIGMLALVLVLQTAVIWAGKRTRTWLDSRRLVTRY
jgi:hypothetical protein